MKTTQNLNSVSQEKPTKKLMTNVNLPIKSVRPVRSMARVKSLKPKRLNLALTSKQQ